MASGCSQAIEIEQETVRGSGGSEVGRDALLSGEIAMGRCWILLHRPNEAISVRVYRVACQNEHVQDSRSCGLESYGHLMGAEARGCRGASLPTEGRTQTENADRGIT